MSDLQMKTWHIENLYEVEPDCQVVIYSEAADLIEYQQQCITQLQSRSAETERCLRASIDDESNKAVSVIGAVQNYIALLEKERNELAATVERLREACTSQRAHLKGSIATLRRQLNECELLCTTLAEHDAEVARKAYEQAAIDFGFEGMANIVDEQANEYAQRIKDGE